MDFKFCNKQITPAILKQEKWLKYLLLTEENQINVEHLNSVSQLQQNQVLAYVERTLMAVRFCSIEKEKYRKCVIKTLQWSEVAKAGSKRDRARWIEQGLQLEIHNEASAEIYLQESDDDLWTTKMVYTLIKTHGLLGQYLRGEVSFFENAAIAELLSSKLICKEHLAEILHELNRAIITGVSPELWKSVEKDIDILINIICKGKAIHMKEGNLKRLQKLFPAFKNVDALTKAEEKLYDSIFAYHDLWYPQIALSSFSRKEINTIFSIIAKADRRKVKHISFYDLSRSLAYDYEGKRKENIYKKRIIELYLREYSEEIEDLKSKEHVNITAEVRGNTLFFNVKFTPVCESLINFCVEAERSGFMDYQKNITTIFDLFGFRRDIFDRLNNEEKYLQTMNDAKNSTKLELLDHVQGNIIVDVGSGGGVLLDMLEEKYPDKKIIGTDISSNVIETLNQKIQKEKHKYSVIKHNFVEGPLAEKVDTIIFSSILHEVFSYTEFEGMRFNLNTVKTALTNAYNSLNENGVLLIRDGVLTDSNEVVKVIFNDNEGIHFCKNFINDFKGLSMLREINDSTRWNPALVHFENNELTADINFVREALYTYTWGNESYAMEKEEQFGYFTFNNYSSFLKELGLEITLSKQLTEEGYPSHLNDKVKLYNFTWEDIPSTCIFVAQKK